MVEAGAAVPLPTCDQYVDLYLADYARQNKASSLRTQTRSLQRFRRDFSGRSLDISRAELKDWIYAEGTWSGREPVPNGHLAAVISLYNHAIDESDLPLARSPARKLTPRRRGRIDKPPPSPAEFEALVAGCAALGDYGETMRALLLFAAYTLMRPGELYALEWGDIDFAQKRIRKRQRVYMGELDVPKTGPRLIALTPPARAAIKRLPRDCSHVFPSKSGARLSTSTFSKYWSTVLEAAGVRFEFYHATKHFGVHYMWTKLGLSPRAIAAQAGWKLETANQMLAVYGHGECGALEEVDQAFRPARGLSEGGSGDGPDSLGAGPAYPGFPAREVGSRTGFPGRDVGRRLDSWLSHTAGPSRGPSGDAAQPARGGVLGEGEAARLGRAEVGAENELDQRGQDLWQALGFADE